MPLETWNGLNVSSLNRTYQSVVNTTCFDGYYFKDETVTKEITCDAHGNWQPEMPTCESEQIIQTQIFIMININEIVLNIDHF